MTRLQRSRTSPRRRVLGLSAPLAWLTLLFICPAARSDDSLETADVIRGAQLFAGAVPLQGRLYTQSEDLPTAAVRCANCHSHGGSADVSYSNAPRLTREWLQEDRKRRGGPKSHYDLGGFCSLLRTGIAPDRIVINIQMPRYALSDNDCRSLWVLLTEEPSAYK